MPINQPAPRSAMLQHTAVRRETLAQTELTTWFAATYGQVAAYLGRHGISPTGHPFARYHVRGDGRFDVEAGFPVTAPIAGDASVVPSTLPGGQLAAVWYTGPYDGLGEAYEALSGWIEAQDGTLDGDPWEVYYEPPSGDPVNWRTEVVQPYKPAGTEQ